MKDVTVASMEGEAVINVGPAFFLCQIRKKFASRFLCGNAAGFFVLFCLFTSLNFPQMEEDKVSKKKEF